MTTKVTLTEQQVCALANRVADLRRSKSYRDTPITRIISVVVQDVPQARPLVAAELGRRGARRSEQKALERHKRAELHEKELQEYLAERFMRGARKAQYRDRNLPDP